MRRDPRLTFTRAARLQRLKPEIALLYLEAALEKVDGKWRPRDTDHLQMTLYLPDAHGNSVPVETHSSNERKQISQYLRDVGRYLRGQVDALAHWHGKKIAGVELVTDGRTIRAIEPALSDFSLYRTFGGGDR